MEILHWITTVLQILWNTLYILYFKSTDEPQLSKFSAVSVIACYYWTFFTQQCMDLLYIIYISLNLVAQPMLRESAKNILSSRWGSLFPMSAYAWHSHSAPPRGNICLHTCRKSHFQTSTPIPPKSYVNFQNPNTKPHFVHPKNTQRGQKTYRGSPYVFCGVN